MLSIFKKKPKSQYVVETNWEELENALHNKLELPWDVVKYPLVFHYPKIRGSLCEAATFYLHNIEGEKIRYCKYDFYRFK